MKNNIPKCIVDGCTNNATGHSKKRDGSIYYRKVCSTHHRKKYDISLASSSKRRKFGETLDMDRSICKICGWDKAPCDRHRVVHGVHGGKYEIDNILSVCPNCHRLIHMGLLDIKNY